MRIMKDQNGERYTQIVLPPEEWAKVTLFRHRIRAYEVQDHETLILARRSYRHQAGLSNL